MKLKCRSGDGCDEPTLPDRKFCEHHAAQLDSVAVRVGALSGPRADRAYAKLALELAAALWLGDTRPPPEVIGARPTSVGYRRAMKICAKNAWLTKVNGRWCPGEVRPPGVEAPPPPTPRAGGADALGRIPIGERAKRLADHVAAAAAPVGRREAADALGLESVDGSLNRIIRRAKDDGLIRAQARPQGLVPGEKLAGRLTPRTPRLTRPQRRCKAC